MPDQDEIIARVRTLETARASAMLASDVAALTALLSRRLVYTHSRGYRDTRDSLLAKMERGALSYVTLDLPADQFIVTGDAVVVVGKMIASVLVDGEARQLNNLSLAVWAHEDDGQWRLVAFQTTAEQPH
jgi:ketosteroid isomerase-like protein